ncbi:YggT family protein [Ketobacter sp. MCCC 1A13808]|uniref:YggT family protein n=1 Tax=Ketobacter sp. MCCC 1A13808 TaxID=2602738 RepID=UPI000F0F802C|nr:YggT family protein [Ketobacter sp. MCCC 1A13808]MVF13660.1 YggT family protein [Ketobacter sp. MCCC 1A13808]RLP53160.1 MAG: YggT family protein [Ketobacter sp.]
MNVSGAFRFLIDYAFMIYLSIVLARFILQLVRADFYNPISQFIVKATSPLLNPLRRVVPGVGGIDMASLVLFILLVVVKLALYMYVFHILPVLNPLQMFILLLMSIASTVINFFLFVIFAAAILSWVVAASGNYNPVVDILNQIAEPVLAPARKIIPAMGGLDISPMLVMIALIFIKQLFGLNGIP